MRSLRTRLMASILAVTALVVGAAWLVAEPLRAEQEQREILQSILPVADEMAAALARGEPGEVAGDRIARARVAIVIVRDAEGVLTTSSEVGLPSPSAAEVRARGRVVGSLTDESGGHWAYVDREASGAVIRIARPFPPSTAARSVLWEVMGIASLIAVVMAAILAEYLTRTITRPIGEMTEAAKALGRGDLRTRVRPRRRDELGALAGAIDQMADQLVDRVDAAQQEEGRLRTVLDSMVEAVLVTDSSGTVVLTNAAFVRLTGADALGRTAVEAIRSPELHDAERRARTGVPSDSQLELRVGEVVRTLSAHVAPLPRMSGAVAVLHDVTELKRADAVRRDFVANASHELRTPLTAIRGFAETLQEGALDDPKIAKRFVASIADNALRLQRLVEDLLELSRAESPDARFELIAVDVEEAVQKVLRGLESRAAEKKQTLTLEPLQSHLRARADARALDQVLLNLVDNAIKYTPDEGRITLRVEQHDDDIAIEVSDTGPGIPRAHRTRIFERFYRVDKGRARSQGGTGLGLSIVKHLVQRMGGEVSVDSTVGEGSSFKVTLAVA